jgi:hypothetical protein
MVRIRALLLSGHGLVRNESSAMLYFKCSTDLRKGINCWGAVGNAIAASPTGLRVHCLDLSGANRLRSVDAVKLPDECVAALSFAKNRPSSSRRHAVPPRHASDRRLWNPVDAMETDVISIELTQCADAQILLGIAPGLTPASRSCIHSRTRGSANKETEFV